VLNKKCCFSSVDGWKISRCHQRRPKRLLMLAELAQHVAIMGEMGELYKERYLYKGDYREMT
jgi:hypothetical protein